MDYNLLATFALLVGLELVLGIDNILLISIICVAFDPENHGVKRTIGPKSQQSGLNKTDFKSRGPCYPEFL